MSYLSNFKTEKLSEWWNVFNEWKWPSDFIVDKPNNWDYIPNRNFTNKEIPEKFTYLIPHIKEIESVIGLKECLRWHWKHNLNKNRLQFEWWWLVNHSFLMKFRKDE